MKQISTLLLAVIGIAAVVFATASIAGRKAPDVKQVAYADTAGLAQFQALKAQQLALAQQQAVTPPVQKVVYVTKPAKRVSQSGYMKTTTQNAAKAPEKKGWSKAAKGTAIGAGAGAVIGGIINKRAPAVGAVIGGVVGGGVGYGIGRSMDKKDGRY